MKVERLDVAPGFPRDADGVPAWLVSLPVNVAIESARWWLRSCLDSATRHRCAGYSAAPFYAAARVWLRIVRALESRA
jgi:hypothetical protein